MRLIDVIFTGHMLFLVPNQQNLHAHQRSLNLFTDSASFYTCLMCIELSPAHVAVVVAYMCYNVLHYYNVIDSSKFGSNVGLEHLLHLAL